MLVLLTITMMMKIPSCSHRMLLSGLSSDTDNSSHGHSAGPTDNNDDDNDDDDDDDDDDDTKLVTQHAQV